MNKILHLMFSYSAAASLRQAIVVSERDDEVVAIWDDFSEGPINPPALDLRTDWLWHHGRWQDQGGCDELRLDLGRDEHVWERVSGHEGRLIVWLSRRSAIEYSGFLEFVWRLEGRHFELVDITDYLLRPARIRNGETFGPLYAVGAGILNPSEFFTEQAFGRVAVFAGESRVQCRDLWAQLRAENAPLRVLENGRLTSAPLSYFDERFFSFVEAKWRKGAWIVGHVLGDEMDRNEHQFGDMFCWARLVHLAETGRIEARGNLALMRESELRLPG